MLRPPLLPQPFRHSGGQRGVHGIGRIALCKTMAASRPRGSMPTFTESKAISPMQVIGMARPDGKFQETTSKANVTALPLSYLDARFSRWIGESRVLKSKAFPIDKIYVPAKRRQTLDKEKVGQIAESMLQKGQDTPIMVREDGERLVLLEGLHRLEACRSLGEQTILGYLVQARKH